MKKFLRFRFLFCGCIMQPFHRIGMEQCSQCSRPVANRVKNQNLVILPMYYKQFLLHFPAFVYYQTSDLYPVVIL
jgi:hypothetical protein